MGGHLAREVDGNTNHDARFPADGCAAAPLYVGVQVCKAPGLLFRQMEWED